jgi:glycosyltransferase involved in cell wall biosynthesis
MKELELLSIVLCTYNGDKYLTVLLDSLLAQSYPHLEIVIVDDASTDQTWSILEKYAVQDGRIRLFQNEVNLGYNANFEKALQLCNGTWIAICDQDDIWHPHKLKVLYNFRDEHLMLYHDSELINWQGELLGKRISDKFNCYRGGDPTVFLLMNCVSGHSIFMHRSLLQYLFPIPPSIVYDQWIAYVAALHGSIHFFNEPLVQYRQHQHNATDLLGIRSVEARRTEDKINLLRKEAAWLQACAERFAYSPEVVKELATLCTKRNKSFWSLRYGWTIWKHRKSLLFLKKKGIVSNFFYVVRKIWGIPAKRIWG